MYAKVNPYLRPLYDALFDMMEMERANRLIERGEIEIAPLAFMRGRTLNDSFVILDEAQNATAEQMKMFLTRLGFHSKAVVTGDITQVDLPADRVSGLVQIRKILRNIDGIEFVYFDERDVVRHRLVQEIIKAYDRHGTDNGKDLPLISGPAAPASSSRLSKILSDKIVRPKVLGVSLINVSRSAYSSSTKETDTSKGRYISRQCHIGRRRRVECRAVH